MGPRLAQGLLESLDDEAGGVGLHVHFGLAVPEERHRIGQGSQGREPLEIMMARFFTSVS